MKNKSSSDTLEYLKYFQGTYKIKTMYSDNSGESKRACKKLKILREGSRPGVPQSNAKIERTNLDILEGTRTSMIHAGFPECFWPFAAPAYCFLDNTNILGRDGNPIPDGSAWYLAKGEESKAIRIPFGCEVIFMPSATRRQVMPLQSGKVQVWLAYSPATILPQDTTGTVNILCGL